MNALLSFKRSGKSGLATRSPDPLLDSAVYLEETPLESEQNAARAEISTLKFLDTKRELEREQATSGSEPANRQEPAPVKAASDAGLTIQATTHTAPSNEKPSRLQLFKQRVVSERSDAMTLPFRQTKTSGSVSLATLSDEFRLAMTDIVLLGKQASPLPAGARHNDSVPANSSARSSEEADTARFRQIRRSDNLHHLLETALPASSADKSLLLQWTAEGSLDFCAGAAELFVPADTAGLHELVEDDHTRTVRISSADRIALDSPTAAHQLRHRSADTETFSQWLTHGDEGDLDADIDGLISPIETFVQAELLNLQQHGQRTIAQLRRLARHLDTHCPRLTPLEALHDARQADAWMQTTGNAAPAALYRLLEAPVRNAARADCTVNAVLRSDAATSVRLADIELPHQPVSLLLLQTIASLAQTRNFEQTLTTDWEQLALFDHLIRKPALDATVQPGSSKITLELSHDTLKTVHSHLTERFASLADDLRKRGLMS